MNIHRLEISYLQAYEETLGHHVVTKARDYLDILLEKVVTSEVLTICALVDSLQSQKILEAIVNPVTCEGFLGYKKKRIFDYYISVGFLPGVTDNLGRSAKALAKDVLGRSLTDDEHIYSSKEFFVSASKCSLEQLYFLAEQLLANTLIQSMKVLSYEDWKKQGPVVNIARVTERVDAEVKVLNLLDFSDKELESLSRKKTLALTLGEMKVIQNYIKRTSNDEERKKLGLQGVITDAELECVAQTWSEHCKHKIFAADIDYTDENGKIEKIKSLYKSYIQKSTKEIGEKVDWLVSVFKDNAGVISFNDKYDLVYKVETHNSPSALDPYGGAMTGIVGVNRDPMGTGKGANLLINTWGYCLGFPETEASQVPEGLLHPRRIRDGVHQGVIDGGNQSGIPYGLGWEYFDKRFLGKPLVYCGTVGLLPRLLEGKSGAQKHIDDGDLIVMVGGRVGKDGIHGATFSSEELHNQSPIQSVQIGDPITQKCMYDFIMEARDLNLYNFITDNGAGGLSSSIGEMSNGRGCYMDLAKVPLKYASLQPWEILVSEAQERMSLAVPPNKIEQLQKLADSREVEISVLGHFNTSGKFHIVYNEKTVCYLDLEFMHNGLPSMQLKGVWKKPEVSPIVHNSLEIGELILRLLANRNINADEQKARQYDHEVKGLSVIKPFVGRNNDVASDATIFMAEPVTCQGIVLAYAVAPSYSDIDTYDMMASVIDLAVRRTVAVGGSLDKIAGLDNFCWPDPVQSEKTPDGEYKLAQLVRANKALYDYTKAFTVPCISGKDSMKNDSIKAGEKISIPPTVLFSTIATIKHIAKATNLAPKKGGDLVYVIGETFDELGGSQYALLLDQLADNVPRVDALQAREIYQKVSRAIERELCQSVHTPSFGGLAVGLAKMSIASELGIRVDVSLINQNDLGIKTLLFSESNSRFIITVSARDKQKFEEQLQGSYFSLIGRIEEKFRGLKIFNKDQLCANLNLSRLQMAYKKGEF